MVTQPARELEAVFRAHHARDRKSTRLNSSHLGISYAVFCLKKKMSLRMQGVEFDNGDMYVDVYKAASDVRDEFVSVTEKLMDELAQCYNVLSQLDINNTIDHRTEGDETWFLENEKTVTQFCRKLAAERPLKDIRDDYNYLLKKRRPPESTLFPYTTLFR